KNQIHNTIDGFFFAISPFRWSGGRLSSSKALCSYGYAFPPSDRDPRFPHQRSTRPLVSSQRRDCIRSLLRSDKKLPRLKYHELNARHTTNYSQTASGTRTRWQNTSRAHTPEPPSEHRLPTKKD